MSKQECGRYLGMSGNLSFFCEGPKGHKDECRPFYKQQQQPENTRKPGEVDEFEDGWGMVMPGTPMTEEQAKEFLRQIADKEKRS